MSKTKDHTPGEIPYSQDSILDGIMLLEPRYADVDGVDEPKSILVRLNGSQNLTLVEASRFGFLEFQKVCEQITGATRSEIIKTMDAYNEMKRGLGYGGIVTRLTGEPAYHHSKAVALKAMTEYEIRDINIVISCLLHDIIEESLVPYGNDEYSGSPNKVRHIITPFDVLKSKYGRQVAQIVLPVCKKKLEIENPTPEQKEKFIKEYFMGILTMYPQTAKKSAMVKSIDRENNIDTEPTTDKQIKRGEKNETVEERMRRQTIETIRFVLPVSYAAGDRFYETLREKIQERVKQLHLQNIQEDSDLMALAKRYRGVSQFYYRFLT